MAFEKIQKVPTPQEIMDRAFKEARKKPIRARKLDTDLQRQRTFARERITRHAKSVQTSIRKIPTDFPSIDQLSEFYQELFKLTININEYKQYLARIQNTAKVIEQLRKKYRGRIEQVQHVSDVTRAEKEYHGRVNSVLQRIKKPLTALEEIRTTFPDMPVVKSMPTVCIAGFPNAGKTTLFAQITESPAEINTYPFTTKGLNIGYHSFGSRKIQFIDTPGTLRREKKNRIEEYAYLALKYLADVIVFVCDPLFEYSFEKQVELRDDMDFYDIPVLTYISKQDIADKQAIQQFTDKYDIVSQKEIIDELTTLLFKKHYR